MRPVRSFGTSVAVAGLAAGSVLAASPASAAVTPSVSVEPVARRGLQGVSATLTVRYACDAGVTAGLGGTLQQSVGHRRIASGTGWQYPVLCDGTARTVGLLTSGNVLTFRKGTATASATLQEQLSDGSVRNTTTGYVKVTLKR